MQSWRDKPSLFVSQALGVTPEPWQSEALQAIADNDRVAIRSGHGVGKSTLLAWVVLWWLLTRYPAKGAATAPTAHQLSDVLWGEVAKWHRVLREPFKSLIRVKSEKVELIAAPAEQFAVARTARKEEPEAFQGFHSEHMLFIVDEASGVEDIIFEVGAGAMSTRGAKTVMAGNPTRTSGYFYEAFHKARQYWHVMQVRCDQSSRVSPRYIDEMRDLYGESSNIYRVRVLGEFPTSEDDVVVPLHLCEAAINRDVTQTEGRMIWGLDVARFGSDRTALARRRSNTMREAVMSWHGKDLMQVCGLVYQEYLMAEHKPDTIAVDVIGLGAGVLDRLREMGLPAVGVNVAESPSTDDRLYMRLRDELWFKVRKWLETRAVRMADDPGLIGELTAVKYKVESSGKIKVESKDDMKKRGLRSPDLADAFMLTFAVPDTVKRQTAYFPQTREDS